MCFCKLLIVATNGTQWIDILQPNLHIRQWKFFVTKISNLSDFLQRKLWLSKVSLLRRPTSKGWMKLHLDETG
jgi:hypothetical protein